MALLSYGFWRQRFGGDPGAVGRTLQLEGVPTTVIGVLPDLLRFPFAEVQIWLPHPDEVSFMSRRALDIGAGYLQVAARLRRGVALDAARRELGRIEAAYRETFPGHIDITYPLAAAPMNDLLVGATRTTLAVLLGATALVLLIACADVANLLLADGLARRREIATRIALGAGRWRIFVQALGDSLLLAGAGGLLGVLLAWGGLRLLVAASPADLPRIGEAGLSVPALAWAVAVTALAGVLAGLAPAWQTLATDPRSFLAEGERGGAGTADRRWGQGLLVTGQVALALALLSAASLLLASLARVQHLPLGLLPDNLLFVQVTLPEAKYPGPAARRVFFEGLLDRVRALPGVESAALVEYPPTAGAPHTTVTVDGRAPLPPERQPLLLRLIANDGYFRTLHTRFVAGRDFDPHAAPDAPPEAILSRSLRDLLFPGENPLGRILHPRGSTAKIEVVGVVEDIQQDPLEAGLEPILYLSHHQAGPDLSPPNFMQLAVRTALPVGSVAGSLRRAVAAIDPAEPLPELATMSQMLAAATARRRLATGLFSGFSVLALVLCLLGVYGVVAHSVTLRRREIGVRMALGARRAQVLGGALGLGARWIAPGLVLGGLGAWLTGRAIASQLFEVEAGGWARPAAAAALLAAVALAACLLPAWQATRIDPAAALRTP